MINPALTDYINKAKLARLNDEQIIQNLRQSGWPEQDIQQALFQTTGTQTGKFSQMFGKEYISNNLPEILLRFGLAFVFLYAAFFVANDEAGAKFVPAFVTYIVPLNTFLDLFGIFEILLSVWLLSGFFIKYSALLTACLLVGITFFNLTYFSTLFRNIAILCAALALFSLKVLQDRKK